MKIALAVVCLVCSLTACGQDQGRSGLDDLIRSAEQGNAEAQYGLGVLYIEGQDVPQDRAEGLKWYRLAAEQGHVAGQFSLGMCYYSGQGVPQDYIQTHMWFNLAASRAGGADVKSIAKARDDLAGEMTRQQIAEAQRLAREWKPKTWDELKDQ